MSVKTSSKMFPFITKTWNPLGGECLHNCVYCWAKKLSKKYNMKKYMGKPTLNTKELNKNFTKDDFVFVCDMTDLFGVWVPIEIIQAILDCIAKSSAKFLLLTKNPIRYRYFNIPENAVAGTTIETDMTLDDSQAPPVGLRIAVMESLKQCFTPKHTMISIEPIKHFSREFAQSIISGKPDFVAVGYDNYNNNLIEPSLENTILLIKELENAGIKVYKKTLREARM
jgi:DNA repair photolyase